MECQCKPKDYRQELWIGVWVAEITKGSGFNLTEQIAKSAVHAFDKQFGGAEKAGEI